ncbi:response regulator [Propionivibrio sp.]|uniref:response regulator n=1 Tax=Propionivibrio sp. TaxID=2212460 RepID=UPI003BF0B0EA
MKIRILLADDHMIFRSALRMVLEMAPDIEIVGEAANGHAVLEAIGESRPEVVCMDLSMPGLSGIETTRQLLARHPEMKVIGLSAHVDPLRIAEMIEAGALGYVAKMAVGEELMLAIRTVNRNQTYFSSGLDLQPR